LLEEEMGFMAVAEDLRIIGVKVDSRDAADEVVERLDQMVDAGQATIREVAIVFKRPNGRVKVHYLHSHAVLIGAGVGVAVGLGGLTIATGGLLWAFIGGAAALGVEAGIGAEIGHAVAKHRRQESKAFLKSMGDTVQAGGAAVLVVCDPPNAEKMLAELRADYPGHETVDLSAAEQESIINSAREAMAAAS
jgi:uncharacterized membrane protein